MKRHHVPVLLALALILPALALTGCPKDAEESTPSGSLGDADLVLKGTVYRATYPSGFEVNYEPYITLDTVVVYAETSDGVETLGEAALTEGGFEIKITKPQAQAITSFEGSLFDMWKDPKAEPGDFKAASISLRLVTAGRGIYKSERELSGDETSASMNEKEVTYWYVDKDVTITLGEDKDEDTDEDGSTYNYTYKAATLKLTKGWNALYTEGDGKYGATTGYTSTTSISVANPDLKWVFWDN
jgi:hypothetical protein